MLPWKRASVKLNEEALINAIALITKYFSLSLSLSIYIYIYIYLYSPVTFQIVKETGLFYNSRGWSNITNVKNSSCKIQNNLKNSIQNQCFVVFGGFLFLYPHPPKVCSIKLIVFWMAEAGFHVLSVVWMKLYSSKRTSPPFLGVNYLKEKRKKKKKKLSKRSKGNN